MTIIAKAQHTAVPDAESAESTLLVFGLAGEAFALPVNSIHEVIDPLPVTPVPNAPPHAPGLINVRGIVTPVVDVRLRLRIPPVGTASGSGRIIVIQLPVEGIITRVAIRADSVDEVIEADPSGLEPVPDLGTRWPPHFVRGVAHHDGRLVVLLDPETLFAPDPDRPAAHS
jgi:purine-binding chemotaxis protein CheW